MGISATEKSEYNKAYYQKNKLAIQANNKAKGNEYWRNVCNKSKHKLRAECLEAYGGKCSCCGETEHDFLTIEHINHDGKAHRLATNRKVYADLRKRGWPKEGITLYCWDCQMATRYGAICPHKRSK